MLKIKVNLDRSGERTLDRLSHRNKICDISGNSSSRSYKKLFEIRNKKKEVRSARNSSSNSTF